MLEYITPLRIIFYVFAIMAVSSGVCVVTLKNPVRSVLALVVTFFAMAGVWMILHAEFLALILLLVYVGAVMTLFLFVVMMLNIDIEDQRKAYVNYFPMGLVIVVLLAGMLMMSFRGDHFAVLQMPLLQQTPEVSNVTTLGRLLFTDYAYPFEVAGVILLVAIIAAITLAHREPRKRKHQNIAEQVAVRPEDRLRIIKMPSVRRGDSDV